MEVFSVEAVFFYTALSSTEALSKPDIVFKLNDFIPFFNALSYKSTFFTAEEMLLRKYAPLIIIITLSSFPFLYFGTKHRNCIP